MDRYRDDPPIPGQPAAMVLLGRRYIGRFPYKASGGRDEAHEYARIWRDREAPKAKVKGFTGRIHHVWEKANG